MDLSIFASIWIQTWMNLLIGEQKEKYIKFPKNETIALVFSLLLRLFQSINELIKQAIQEAD